MKGLPALSRFFSAGARPLIVIFVILIGVTGLSLRVCTFEMLLTTSNPDVTCPKTGWRLLPGLNQSKKELCATLMKNWEPPLFGWPVFAIESEPTTFESFEMFSSSMLPPFERFSVPPVPRLTNVPSEGPPVPACGECGSLECGQPNWFIKPSMTRWKCNPL